MVLRRFFVGNLIVYDNNFNLFKIGVIDVFFFCFCDLFFFLGDVNGFESNCFLLFVIFLFLLFVIFMLLMGMNFVVFLLIFFFCFKVYGNI